MERNVSLKTSTSRRWCVLWLVCLALPMLALTAEPRLALVTSSASPLDEIPAGEVRRLYLGIPVVVRGHEVIPLRNHSDSVAHEIFLQRVLFMSAQAYERQMAARIFRGGGNELRRYDTVQQLVEALARDPWAVSYMPADMAAHLPGIKTIGGL